MWCRNSFRTSGDGLCVDCCAGNVLDCWTAHNMFYTVHYMSYHVWSMWRIKISVWCVCWSGMGEERERKFIVLFCLQLLFFLLFSCLFLGILVRSNENKSFFPRLKRSQFTFEFAYIWMAPVDRERVFLFQTLEGNFFMGNSGMREGVKQKKEWKGGNILTFVSNYVRKKKRRRTRRK